VLSNHFVHYLLVPWNATVAGEREERLLATAHFVKVHGGMARSWTVRTSPGKPGAPLLAAAVDTALIEAITALSSGAGLRLQSIQPALMAACNLQFASAAANAWVALAEPGQLLLGLQHAGQWRSLRSLPFNGETVVLAELIEQERLLLGVEAAGEKVYVHQWGSTPIDGQGLAVERWSGLERAESRQP
jgi:hypothetical protein